jgi:hypothetical protein
MVLIYDEARGHSELAQQIYNEKFPQRILPSARTFLNDLAANKKMRRSHIS